MARRKQGKRSWRKLLLFLITPFVVWLIAFVIWFYWHGVRDLFAPEAAQVKAKPAPAQRTEKDERRERPPESPAQEKILDEERRQLDDILKRRN